MSMMSLRVRFFDGLWHVCNPATHEALFRGATFADAGEFAKRAIEGRKGRIVYERQDGSFLMSETYAGREFGMPS